MRIFMVIGITVSLHTGWVFASDRMSSEPKGDFIASQEQLEYIRRLGAEKALNADISDGNHEYGATLPNDSPALEPKDKGKTP